MCGCDRGSRPELVGLRAPDFSLNNDGHPIALHDLRGKVVVLNFWASWCPPCIQEMPSLNAMQSRLKDRVTIFGVSTDTSETAYRQLVAEQRLTFLNAWDPAQKSNSLYGTFQYPETYIIDRNGTVRRKVIGPVDWTAPEMIDYLSRL